MATRTVSALAKRGLAIKAEMAALQNELASINAKLVKAAEGTTIQLDEGRVIVTTTTIDRPSSVYELRFNKQRFLELDPADDARRLATEAGIIVLEQGVISGRGAVVQYSLNK